MDKKQLNIIMPMCGEGQRMKDGGFSMVKPLIDVNGKYMFEHSVRSIIDSNQDRFNMCFTFIIRQDHESEFSFSTRIHQVMNNTNTKYNIKIIPGPTTGPVETLLLGNSFDNGLTIILDCDLAFNSNELLTFLNENPNNVLCTFKSKSPKFSYVKINRAGNAVKTAEKEVISTHAIMGAYVFENGLELKQLCTDMYEAFKNGELEAKECYTSLLYNILIKNNKIVKTVNVLKYDSFGTPSELKEYINK